jgi:hypothetical protein
MSQPEAPRPYVSAEMLLAGVGAARQFGRPNSHDVTFTPITLMEAVPAIYRAMTHAKVSRDHTAAERQRRFRKRRRTRASKE